MGIKEKLSNIYRREKKDDIEEIKYGIIERNAENCGIFSMIITYLGGIQNCIGQDLIPIIDMQNTPNLYLKKDQVGKVNAWEIFFEQPMGVGLDNVKGCKIRRINVDQMIKTEMRPNLSMDFFTNKGLVEYWRKLFNKYIRFNSDMKFYINQIEEDIINKYAGRKLGILCRGTDYTDLRPFGHPVQPTVEMVIEKAQEVCRTFQCKYVFLATEDEEIYLKFREVFKERLVTVQTTYFSKGHKEYLAKQMSNMDVDVVNNGREYLTSIHFLAQCECFLGGRTSGTVGAVLMSKEFEYQYFWNLGRYGIDDVMLESSSKI